LQIRGADQVGALGFSNGRLVAAVCGDHGGEDALGAIFSIRDATFEFMPWTEAPEGNLEGDLDSLLRRAAESRDRLASIRAVIPDDRTRFRLSERAADQGAVTFTPERWRALLALNGERDVAAIAQHLGIGKMDALNLLAGLVRDGVIEALAAPAEAAPPATFAPPPFATPATFAAPAPASPPQAASPQTTTPQAPPPAPDWMTAPGPAAPEWLPPAPTGELTAPAPAEPAPVAPAPAPAASWSAPATEPDSWSASTSASTSAPPESAPGAASTWGDAGRDTPASANQWAPDAPSVAVPPGLSGEWAPPASAPAAPAEKK